MDWVVSFFDIELHELLVYSRHLSSVRDVVCKYFLILYTLCFHSLNRVFYEQKLKSFSGDSILSVISVLVFLDRLFSFDLLPPWFLV